MIKVKKLSFNIDNKDILKDIDIEIKKHKFVGIIGENGCGKSTLLKNIYKSYSPEDDKIFLEGKDLKKYSIKELAQKISVLSQNQKIIFDFTVKEIVEMGRYTKSSLFYKKDEEKEIDKALEKVGLLEKKHQSFLTLSGGEMQRVFIARSLAQESNILILDEPTNHLDMRYQYQIMNLIKSLNKTVVAVIHDVNIASSYCDYIFAMKDGKIICEGSPEEVITKKKIKKIFEIDVDILPHPTTKKPLVIFL
ncbi:ABC transporter ATP-binding protein [uncultured Cetobacterium sp.]|uniref:ABC transporter ATP-binding protein n=1 Tax=uncultured Cetobacterium sp. TaxID=527638 RepID=UPI00260A962E|nr:ABC transporter ATP-binding protein [uncultured Cetobacterium sp.]